MRKVGTWGVDRFCGMLCEAVLTQMVVILEDRWGRSPGGAEIEDVGENTRGVNGRSCTIDDDADLEGFEDRSSLTPRGLPTCFCKTHFLTVPDSFRPCSACKMSISYSDFCTHRTHSSA